MQNNLKSRISPSDGVEEPQRGEGGAHVHRVQQDEAEDPLHALLTALGHEGRDPQHAAAEAAQPAEEAAPPLVVGQVLEGPLHHRGVHGHQVSLQAHVPAVVLHRRQVTPRGERRPSSTREVLSHARALTLCWSCSQTNTPASCNADCVVPRFTTSFGQSAVSIEAAHLLSNLPTHMKLTTETPEG